MILSAQTIRRLVRSGDLVIEPFNDAYPQPKAFGRSWGLTCAGYDIRLGEDVWLWPFIGRLTFAMERCGCRSPKYRMRIENKSTNARLFIDASRVTNGEPGWVSHLTLELTRDRPWPVFLRKGTPIATIVFEELDEPTERPYFGKYSHQPAAAVPAIMEAQA